jgi:hypothetical protein
LVRLSRYVKDVQPGPVDTLGLTKDATQYALLIFGSLSGGKVYSGLMADATWSKIGDIRGRPEPLKCMVADSKFGTGHDKMLMMVGTSKFNFPSGMKEVSITSYGRPLSTQNINSYFQGFR